ncbi:MAG: DinB family protein [Bryobacteraceae bacterium]
MQIAQALLAEFEQESIVTRRFLERLPEDKLTWKPHERSMSAGQLALHLALVPGQVVELARQDSVPVPEFNQPNPQPESVREVLEALDQSVRTVKGILQNLDDASMQKTWRAMKDGQEIVAMPRAVVLRSILLNHWYQHRGQFSVYLRLLGQKVPASYGPSADELPEFLQQKQSA